MTGTGGILSFNAMILARHRLCRKLCDEREREGAEARSNAKKSCFTFLPSRSFFAPSRLRVLFLSSPPCRAAARPGAEKNFAPRKKPLTGIFFSFTFSHRKEVSAMAKKAAKKSTTKKSSGKKTTKKKK
jgi:hypothetical protein